MAAASLFRAADHSPCAAGAAGNEDAFLIDLPLGLNVVADGMGGHAAGEIASQEAVDTIYGMVKRGHAALTTLTPPPDEGAACRSMESAVQAAMYMVFSMAQIDLNKSGMGTTICAPMVLGAYLQKRAPHFHAR